MYNKELILKNLWGHFYKWVDERSERGLTDILDFSMYNRFVDCWSITVNGKEYTNPSLGEVIKLYSENV